MATGTRRRSSQLASRLASKRRGGFPNRDWLRACPRTTIAWVPFAFLVTPSVIADATWYGNINPLAIGYAFRPRLRSRLTLSRRTLLRKPWTIGGGDSHPSCVTHAGILTSCRSTAARASASLQTGTLSYRSGRPQTARSHSFGGWLEPR
jgi:hypothetical protein